ncbi:MAG: hypothetical protein PHV34_19880 [Verrucomicrobiae bacterium]|nr:hypothetical protein [Verrucomicrobiae bacterium]
MSKIQFFIFSLVAAVLFALISLNIWASQDNRKLEARIQGYQNELNAGRQAEQVLKQIAQRIAQVALQDAAMREMMVVHDFKATVVVDGKSRNVP